MTADDNFIDAREPVTLDNCAREPIHIPGSIQPHGLLFACRGADLRIHQVSANLASWLGVEPAAVLGLPLGGLLGAGSAEQILDANQRSVLRESSPLRIATARGGSFDAMMHRSGDDVIVELEHPPRLRSPAGRAASIRGCAAASCACGMPARSPRCVRSRRGRSARSPASTA
ncbi:MAG TPA: hypothetical protein VGC42_01525 [Kofleriaceae bacterium]